MSAANVWMNACPTNQGIIASTAPGCRTAGKSVAVSYADHRGPGDLGGDLPAQHPRTAFGTHTVSCGRLAPQSPQRGDLLSALHVW
jgi:hypothetical protein